MTQEKTSAIILIHCPDQRGLVATVTDFIHQNNGNILDLEQHIDKESNQFFMRIAWDLDGFAIAKDKVGEFFETLIANKFQMQWHLYFSDKVPRMAIFVSKMSHCLMDLLARLQSPDWNFEVPLVISNHPDMGEVVQNFGIPYYHIPINQKNKAEQEARQLELLREHKVDFIVLARYMQILSADFVQHYPNKVINIHHSFLPAFPGAKPYHSAFKRGVKIVGTTSHYVTADLDAGPIIEQDVIRVDHQSTVHDLVRRGQDLEKIVLARAVWNHLQRKLLVFNNKTIVFN